MIYLANNTNVQEIFIPRETMKVEGEISSAVYNAYQEGYRDGYEAGRNE